MSKPRDFANGYARSHQIYEVVGILLGTACALKLGYTLVSTGLISGWWIPLAVFAGLLGADFTSGLVHWLFDTWGSTSTPIVGQLAIRTFREHHVDEYAMTRHGFVETNGHNITLSLVPSCVGLVAAHHQGLLWSLIAMTCFFMALCVGMTSQIHKWAHLPEERSASRFVRALQDAGVIISARHHERHHARPHDSYYCITVGWMNGPLELVRFFRILERIITAITGVQPREEDLAATAEVHGALPMTHAAPAATVVPLATDVAAAGLTATRSEP